MELGIMLTVLTDADIESRLDARTAVAWMREALADVHSGRLQSPPRVSTEFGEGNLVFTTGALAEEWYGYRSYDTFDTTPGAEVVVVHDRKTGEVRGVVVGNELGPRRVGAIGAVAADLLANPDANTLGMIGTGVQAWNQLWAISTVRELGRVAIYGRNRPRREEFVERARKELNLDAVIAPTPRLAVANRDIVVLATNSPKPVIDAAWLTPGAYVTTLGPKQAGRAEFGPDLVARAHVAVTDSIPQTEAYDPPFVLKGTPQHKRLVSLGAIVAGEAEGRTSPEQTVIFCSVGLAGTETYLAAKLIG
jgi:ornithine cyclodeaminase/alanine dehydrogenase-like protein (mu-crystallin family)